MKHCELQYVDGSLQKINYFKEGRCPQYRLILGVLRFIDPLIETPDFVSIKGSKVTAYYTTQNIPLLLTHLERYNITPQPTFTSMHSINIDVNTRDTYLKIYTNVKPTAETIHPDYQDLVQHYVYGAAEYFGTFTEADRGIDYFFYPPKTETVYNLVGYNTLNGVVTHKKCILSNPELLIQDQFTFNGVVCRSPDAVDMVGNKFPLGIPIDPLLIGSKTLVYKYSDSLSAYIKNLPTDSEYVVVSTNDALPNLTTIKRTPGGMSLKIGSNSVGLSYVNGMYSGGTFEIKVDGNLEYEFVNTVSDKWKVYKKQFALLQVRPPESIPNILDTV